MEEAYPNSIILDSSENDEDDHFISFNLEKNERLGEIYINTSKIKGLRSLSFAYFKKYKNH